MVHSGWTRPAKMILVPPHAAHAQKMLKHMHKYLVFACKWYVNHPRALAAGRLGDSLRTSPALPNRCTWAASSCDYRRQERISFAKPCRARWLR